jgi:hypothetical protein
MKKTKRSRIAFWLVGCSALLVAALAARAQTQNYVVDDFAPAGVGPANPTNYDYYPSAQNYQNGQIDAVWWNWFGGAFVTNQWDATSDASNNPSSGSLKITLNWSSANSQFVLWDQGTNNNYFALGLNATTFTNFQCDIRSFAIRPQNLRLWAGLFWRCGYCGHQHRLGACQHNPQCHFRCESP